MDVTLHPRQEMLRRIGVDYSWSPHHVNPLTTEVRLTILRSYWMHFLLDASAFFQWLEGREAPGQLVSYSLPQHTYELSTWIKLVGIRTETEDLAQSIIQNLVIPRSSGRALEPVVSVSRSPNNPNEIVVSVRLPPVSYPSFIPLSFVVREERSTTDDEEVGAMFEVRRLVDVD